jgi:predicted enzyme related to lactoylglutathione lyase
MPSVVNLEIPANNPQRALEFYTAVFNWKVDGWGTEKYWLTMKGVQEQPPISGAILKRVPPFYNVVSPINVKSVDEFAERIEASGGKIVQPKTAIPGSGWVAYFSDTEGNVQGIYEPGYRG